MSATPRAWAEGRELDPAQLGQQADEADALFRLGRRAYEARNFELALAHFLASNRVVPNSNVRFNIGRSFEQLKRYAEAYQYYIEVRDAERDPAILQLLNDAVARVAPNVAIVQLQSTPAGARVYMDRRDLGVRAVAPRTFALPPGAHNFMFELEGYEPATVPAQLLRVGTPTNVQVVLKRIVGEVTVAQPLGAIFTLTNLGTSESCMVPCALQVPPGRYEAGLASPAIRSVRKSVQVNANDHVQFAAKIELRSIALSVLADIADAEVFIDGSRIGTAPISTRVLAGKHTIRVLRDGYTPAEKLVQFEGDEPVELSMTLQDRALVAATSQAAESVQDAPASVTIIRRDELLAMGYPTIADALRGVRSLYVSDDRTYASIGVRGNAPTGQYGNRVVMMLDGHPLNDNFIWSSYVGYDARVDLEDIDRIEISRGAGAVTHGASAMYAVINLVTRGRGEASHVEATLSAPENGALRARVAGYMRFGRRAGVWASASVMSASGNDYVYPDLADALAQGTRPAMGARARLGEARGIDGWNAASFGGRVWVGDFTAQWFATSRSKQLPTGTSSTLFGSPDNTYADTRGLIEARYEPSVGKQVKLLARAYFDMYKFNSTLAFDLESDFTKEGFNGTWSGAEFRATYTPSARLSALVGVETAYHYRALQRGQDPSGLYLYRDDPFGQISGYASVSAALAATLRITAGVRASYYTLNSQASAEEILNPRVAMTWNPTASTSAKLMLYKAFRPPSVYELHYANATQVAPPKLRSDQLYAAEAELTKTVGKLTLVADAFAWAQPRPIELAPLSATTRTYRNDPDELLTTGLELEARHDFGAGRSVAATYSYQRSWFTGSNNRVPRNSLEHLASLKATYPVIANGLTLSTRVSVEGPRTDKNDQQTDAPQGTTSGAAYWDVVASGRIGSGWLRYAAGIYNIGDMRGVTVPSNEYAQRTLPSPGRSLLLSVTVQR